MRDLAILSTERGEELHLVTGNVDSRDKESVLIQDYPRPEHGGDPLPLHATARGPLGAPERRVRPRVPGPAPRRGHSHTEDGRFFYVTDEDEGVHLRLTRLLAD